MRILYPLARGPRDGSSALLTRVTEQRFLIYLDTCLDILNTSARSNYYSELGRPKGGTDLQPPVAMEVALVCTTF